MRQNQLSESFAAYWRYIATSICVNIGSSNGALPDGVDRFPEPMFIYQERCSVAFTDEQSQKKCW